MDCPLCNSPMKLLAKAMDSRLWYCQEGCESMAAREEKEPWRVKVWQLQRQ